MINSTSKRPKATRILSAALTIACAACAPQSENAVKRALAAHADPTSDKNAKQTDSRAPYLPDGTLESYVAYAMRNSPNLQALFERWQAGVYRIAQARRLPDPVVSYAYFVRNVETKVGPQRHRLSLKQSFPWPTRLTAGADAAAAEARALQQRFDAHAIAVRAVVEEKYWSLWGILATRKVHEEHLAILKGLSESAGALLMTGRIELADQQQIDLTTARTEDLLLGLDEQAAALEAQLRGVIGAPHTMPVTVVSTPTIHDVDVNKRQLIASVRHHPAVRAFEEMAEAGDAAATQETARRFPTFSLGVDWIETGDAAATNVPESGKDAVLIGVGISLPLWQRSYKEDVEALRSTSRAYRADARAAGDRAVADFLTTLAELRDAKRRIALYQTTLIPQAESVFDAVIGTYVSSKGNIAAVLLAQRDLLELRIQLIKIQTAYTKQWAVLENLVGHDISPDSAQTNQSGVAR